MIIATIIAYFLALNASSQVAFTYNINGKKVVMYEYDKQRITINQKCPKLEKGKLCKNIEFLNKMNSSSIPDSVSGGVNMGSYLCTEQLSGLVVMGRTPSNNQNTFCKIKDLYIDISTLEYYSLHKN